MKFFKLCVVSGCAAAMLAGSPLRAETVFGQDFRLNNVVDHGASYLQLTSRDTAGARASAFRNTPLQLGPATSFEAMFAIRIDGGTHGADGMTFTLQSAGPGFLGLAGGNLGFFGPAGSDGNPLPFGPAYAVALDTYQNLAYLDSNDNAVAFLDSSSYRARSSQAAPYDLNSGAELFVWADYDGVAKAMSVFISDTAIKPAAPLVTDPIDLPAWLGTSAYVGFTAATGGLTNDHFVTAFTITAVPEPGPGWLLATGLLAAAFLARQRRRLGMR